MNPNPNDRRDDGHGAPSDALKAPVAGEGLAADATAIREWRDRQKLVEIVARDGHHWLKYGEKPLMRTGIIRAYYRCGFTNKGAGCPAKKTIDRNPDAVVTEENVQVSYSNNHNHQKEQPPQPAERPASIPKAGSEAERQRNPTLKGEASAAGALAAAPASPSAASSRSSARAAVSAAVTNTAATSVAARPTIDSSAARQQRERSELQQSNTARDSSRVHEVITPKAALSSRLIASAPLSPCSATSAPASALSAGAVPISGEILRGRTNPFGSHLVVPSSSNLRKRPFEITQCGGAAAVTAAAAAATCGGGANFTASAAAAAASAAAAAATHTHSPLTGPPQSTHGLTSSFSASSSGSSRGRGTGDGGREKAFPAVQSSRSFSVAVRSANTAAPTVPDTALATGAPAPTAPTTSPATDALAPATAPATGALDPATAPFSASAATGAWGPRALSDAGNSAPPGNHAAVAVVVNRSASVGDIAVATRSGPAGGTVTVTLPSGNTSSRSASYSSPASVQTNTAGLDNGLALPDQARQQKLPPQQQQQQQQQQPGSLEWQEQSKCGRLGLRRVFSDDGSWQVQSFGEQAVGEPISEECPTVGAGTLGVGEEGESEGGSGRAERRFIIGERRGRRQTEGARGAFERFQRSVAGLLVEEEVAAGAASGAASGAAAGAAAMAATKAAGEAAAGAGSERFQRSVAGLLVEEEVVAVAAAGAAAIAGGAAGGEAGGGVAGGGGAEAMETGSPGSSWGTGCGMADSEEQRRGKRSRVQSPRLPDVDIGKGGDVGDNLGDDVGEDLALSAALLHHLNLQQEGHQAGQQGGWRQQQQQQQGFQQEKWGGVMLPSVGIDVSSEWLANEEPPRVPTEARIHLEEVWASWGQQEEEEGWPGVREVVGVQGMLCEYAMQGVGETKGVQDMQGVRETKGIEDMVRVRETKGGHVVHGARGGLRARGRQGAEGIEAHGMEGVRKAEQVREVQSTWETQEVLDLQGCEENQEKAQRMQPMQQPMQQHEMEGQACSACMHAHHPVGPILDPISNQLGTLLQQGIPLLHVPHLPFLPKHSSLAPLSAAPASQAAHWQANPPINSYPLNPLPALTPGAAAAVAGAAAGGGFASIESGTEGYPQEYPMTGLAATSLAPASSAAAAAAPSSAASAAAPSSAASAATAATSFHPPVTLPAFSASGFGEGKSGSSLPTGFPAACAYNARDLVEVAAAGANMEEAESRKPPPSGHSIDDLVTMLPGVIPDIRSNGFPDISVATAEPEDLDLARVILRQIEQQERSMAGGKGGEGGSGSGLGIGAGSEAVVGTAEQQHFPAEQNQRMHDRLDRSSSPPKDLSSRIAVAAALAIAIASSRPNSTSGSRGEGEGGTAQNQAVITAAAAASARQSIRDAAAAPSSVSYLAGGAAASAVDLASLGQAGEECGNKQHHDVFALLGGGDTVSISDFMQDGHDR
ncbi:hypothetical protein CLOP_g18335 [Closterium sp. NIES-67]|nr:hypothetical protein CLOP_g18335 [Closterium sp. NIES-67]